MNSMKVVVALSMLVACGKKQDAPAPTKTPPAAAPAKPAAASFTFDRADGSPKVGPLAFDHQVMTDDGYGNKMLLLIANCPQIKESCSIIRGGLREDRDKLTTACPGWSEVAVVFGPKTRGPKGPLSVPPGKYTSAGDPVQTPMVEYSDSDPKKTFQMSNEKEPMIEVTRSDAKGMAGTIMMKGNTKATLDGTFDTKACDCSADVSACKPVN